MKNKSNKSDKYLELAKEVRLANVPNKGKEAESLLNSTKSGTAQNIFTRIFNYFGRHLIMTITSLITLIVAGLLLTNTEQLKEQPVESKMINNTKPVERKIDKEDLVYTGLKDEKDDTNNITQDSSVTISTSYKLDELTWDLLVFNHESWDFQYIAHKDITTKYTSDGDSSKSVTMSQIDLEEKYLIPIERQLEDSIKSIVDINHIKSICNLEIDNYFMELANLGKKISKYDDSDKLINMVNLYAHINRKFLKNPSEEMKIKSKGIILPKETLLSLGITFSDSTVNIPQDDYYENGEYRDYIIDWYRSDNITSEDLPNNDIVLKKNIIYEWTTNAPQYDSDGNINWYKSYFPATRRVENPAKYMGILNLDKYTNVHSYYNLMEVKQPDAKARLCPMILEDVSTQNYHDMVLKNSNEQSRNIYEYYNKMEEKFNKIRLNKDNMPEAEYRATQLENSKQQAIFNNMIASYKYRYLIPVDIQLPYYNLSKEELEKLDYYTSITLWYYPSEEFLSKLPEDIRTQLEIEIELANEIHAGELQPEEACAEVGGEGSLLGLCNLTDKAISNLNVYPNPAQDNINIKFELTDNRMYKIIVTDLTGNYMQDITDWKEAGEGEITFNYDLSDMDNGAYLVQVITEKSEKLLAKFMIKK